jgi:hypothetical protein
MLVLRIILPLAALFLLGLVAAWAITKDRKYLDIARKSVIVLGLLLVAFALLYIFERVLLL